MKSDLKLEIPSGLSPSMEKIAHLLFGDLTLWKKLRFDPEFKSEVLYRQNPARLAEGRALMQNLLNQIFQINSKDLFRAEALIGNILCFYPYVNPAEGQILSIPHYIDQNWRRVDYRVEKIILTPSWMGSPVEACGLIPVTDNAAPPRLIFKGTTYPADKGLLLQLMTDLNPAMAVGSYLFMIGKKKIDEWMRKVGGCVWVCGLSLGGALTELTSAYSPQWVARGDAYNAPGLDCRTPFKQNLPQPLVNIYTQPYDIVSQVGTCLGGENWNLWSIIPSQEIKNILISHVHVNLSDPQAQIVQLNRCQEERKWSRRLSSLGFLVLAIPLFLLLLVIWLFKLLFKR